MKWVKKWVAPSSSREGNSYIVSQDEEGNYGCSCPVWKFRRKDCKHIEAAKAGELQTQTEFVLSEMDDSQPPDPLYVVARRSMERAADDFLRRRGR